MTSKHSTWPSAERAAITEISRSNGMKASRIADLVPSSFQIAIRIVAVADDRLALAVIAEAAGLEHGGQAERAIACAQIRDRRYIGVIGGADAEPLDEILLGKTILRGFQDFAVGQHRPARAQDQRRGRRHVLEFVGDDVDVAGEQLQRLDIGIFGAGRVQHHVECRRFRVRRKYLAAQAEPAAAIASIRPNCPPPRIPMVSPGFSFTGEAVTPIPPAARRRPRSAPCARRRAGRLAPHRSARARWRRAARR